MGSRPSTFTLTSPGAMRMFSTSEMMHMQEPEWLIEGVVPAGGLVGLYGAPGVKKSFLSVDIALSVAAGVQWQGRTVQRGYVLYVVAEGGSGMGKRIRAWLLDRDVSPDRAQVAWLPEAVPVFVGSNGMDTLIDRIHNELDRVPSLVIIDTLARCFDGDENQQADMGRFVTGIDHLRKEFDATVLVVHHTRLDGTRERGNTSFRGAADTMLRLTQKKDMLILSCDKQKDAEEFEDIEIRTKAIESADSIVIATATRAVRVVSRQTEVRDMLRASGPMTWDQWSTTAKERGISGTSFNRYIRGCKENGEIVKENGVYRLT